MSRVRGYSRLKMSEPNSRQAFSKDATKANSFPAIKMEWDRFEVKKYVSWTLKNHVPTNLHLNSYIKASKTYDLRSYLKIT